MFFLDSAVSDLYSIVTVSLNSLYTCDNIRENFYNSNRNDVTQTVTLCPLANSRGSVNILNGKKGMIGFDRWLWYTVCSQAFDISYNHYYS